VGDAARCDVVVRTTARALSPTRVRLLVTAENAGGAPATVELPDRCPHGPIDFEGLGPTFDYYGTCAAGACLARGAGSRVTLSPGQTLSLVEVDVALDGPGCSAPAPPGRHLVRAIPPRTSAPACSVGATVEVAATPRAPPNPSPAPAPRVTPAPPEPGAPSARDPSDPYACDGPGQCMLACPEAPGCCGWSCGCRHAIHRDHAASFTANYPATCQRAPCPAVGCAYEPAASATCRNGRCVAASGVAF
jgi:hypothetical protein